jgi:hypothetical protein
LPKSSDIAGTASASSTAAVRSAETQGRRVTAAVQLSQKPRRCRSGSVEPRRRRRVRAIRISRPKITPRRPRAYARLPSTFIRTGSRLTAARIETATTMIAPIAIERIVVESTR